MSDTQATGTGRGTGSSTMIIADSPPTGLTSSTSPPLIIAFLAIGIFTVSIMGILGWRRTQIRRALTQGGDAQWLEFPLGPNAAPDSDVGAFGRRPRFWDLWTTTAARRTRTRWGACYEKDKDLDQDQETGWDMIMSCARPCVVVREKLFHGFRSSPVAAVVIAPQIPNDGTTASALLPPRPLALRYTPWRRRRPASSTPSLAPVKEGASTDKGAPQDDTQAGQLQVAVAIAMPSRSRSRCRRTTVIPTDTFEYTLGLYECDWRRRRCREHEIT
ncbi:hypothetical protein D9615_006081 [Tricholomella constricta]|uniref:Uncharacterized protein n=1 Tax=Tricholomella constricta TaxID=117010 RepID=A0A8H5H9B1_9AGAR|nr:hypothetical protein D9615_006081 [Tricholomella constricta]